MPAQSLNSTVMMDTALTYSKGVMARQIVQISQVQFQPTTLSHLMFCHVYTFADEMDCVTFTKETGYLKEVPPPPVQLTGRHSFDGGKTDIGVHVNISAILVRSTKCHLLIACLIN